MVDYLGALPGIILVWTVFFHTDVTFLKFSTSGITWGFATGLSDFFPSTLTLGNLSIFGINVKLLLLIGRNKIVFWGSLVGFLLCMPLQ